MHITQVGVQNFKGQDFNRTLGPITVIVGDNFSGKTTVPDAIRLALTGYLPQIGKLPGATYGTLAGNPDDPGTMEVAVKFDTGRESRLTFIRTKKGSVSVEGAVPMDLALNPMLADVRTFFAMTGADRINAIFAAAGNVKIEAKAITDAIGEVQASPVKVRDAVLRKLGAEVTAGFSGVGTTAQAAVDRLLTAWTAEAKEARVRHKVAAGAFAGMTLPLSLPKRPENLDALREKRDALVAKRGELKTLLAGNALVASLRVKITETEAAVALASKALEGVTDPGPEPTKPEILIEFDAAQSELDEIQEANADIAERLGKARLNIERLSGVTICPTCGQHADNAKLIEREKTSVTELEAAMERNLDQATKFNERFEDIASIAGQYEQEVDAWTQANEHRAKLTDELENQTKRLTGYRSQLAAAETDQSGRIAELTKEVEALPEATMDVTLAEQSKTDADNYDRLLEAREAKEQEVLREECTATVYAESVKAVNRVVQEVSERAFKTVLELSDDFTRGLLNSPLEFRDGELGRTEDGGWIPHTAFSGTEQLLAYAGFSVALARTAGFRLVVLDEMGRLSLGRRQDVAIRMEELIAAGKIDQAILIDATVPGTVRMLDGRDALDVYGEKAVRIVL